MIQQLGRRARWSPGLCPQGAQEAPEGDCPAVAPGTPVAQQSLLLPLSQPPVDRGSSLATTSVLFHRSLTSCPPSTRPLPWHLPQNTSQKSDTSLYAPWQRGSVTSNPTSYYPPLAPFLQTQWASGQFGDTPTSGPLHMLFLPRPLPREPHISPPRLLQVHTHVLLVRPFQATLFKLQSLLLSPSQQQPLFPRSLFLLCSLRALLIFQYPVAFTRLLSVFPTEYLDRDFFLVTESPVPRTVHVVGAQSTCVNYTQKSTRWLVNGAAQPCISVWREKENPPLESPFRGPALCQAPSQPIFSGWHHQGMILCFMPHRPGFKS